MTSETGSRFTPVTESASNSVTLSAALPAAACRRETDPHRPDHHPCASLSAGPGPMISSQRSNALACSLTCATGLQALVDHGDSPWSIILLSRENDHEPRAVVEIVHDADLAAAFGELSRFRSQLYGCLSARADALFELCDALLCTEALVRSLVDLTLVAEHRRGHGAMYDGLNQGRIDLEQLRTMVAGLVLPRADDGRLMLAVHVSPWLRPDAVTSPDRLFCHVYGRGRNADQFIPGWPYSFVAALEPGRSLWTAVLDAVRLGPDDDVAEVTAEQVRAVVQRLIAAGQWRDGDPRVLIVFDSG